MVLGRKLLFFCASKSVLVYSMMLRYVIEYHGCNIIISCCLGYEFIAEYLSIMIILPSHPTP